MEGYLDVADFLALCVTTMRPEQIGNVQGYAVGLFSFQPVYPLNTVPVLVIIGRVFLAWKTYKGSWTL